MRTLSGIRRKIKLRITVLTAFIILGFLLAADHFILGSFLSLSLATEIPRDIYHSALKSFYYFAAWLTGCGMEAVNILGNNPKIWKLPFELDEGLMGWIG